MKMRLWVVVLVLMAAGCAVAQELPKFDAVVVRPHDAAVVDEGGGVHWEGLMFQGRNIPLAFLLTQAFATKKWLIEGMPAWAGKGTWDFEAKLDPSAADAIKHITHEQIAPYLQVVLQDQFGLRYHFENRVEPVYELTVLPGGPRFKPSPAPDGDASKRRPGNWNFFNGDASAKRITMAQFANKFSPLVERVIVDKTGLADMYDLAVKWRPEDAATRDDAEPGVFTAVREQLGLKLTPAKAPVPVLVIDALTQPDSQ